MIHYLLVGVYRYPASPPEDGDSYNPISINVSSKTVLKVKELEKEANTDKGVFGRAGSAATFKQPDSVVSGNYDLVKISGTKSSNSKAVGNAKNYDDFIIWIAVPEGQSTVTDDIMVTQLSKLINS